MTVLAVVVLYNSERWLQSFAEAIRLLGIEPAAVVAVDNGSVDASVARAKDLGFDVVEMGYNAGFGAATNAGVKWFDFSGRQWEWLAILNPDISAAARSDDESLPAALARVSDNINLLVPILADRGMNVAPYPRASFWLRWLLGSTTFGARLPSDGIDLTRSYVVGSAVLIRRQLWSHLKGFDEDFFLYGEDADLSARAVASDAAEVATIELPLVHHGNEPVALLPAHQQRLMFEGVLRFNARHASRSSVWFLGVVICVGSCLRGLMHVSLFRREQALRYFRSTRACASATHAVIREMNH